MRFVWTGILALAITTGCSTTSTITRANAPPIEAHIVGSDSEAVYIGPKDAPEAIPRSEITDIDYPGDAATGYGAVLTGLGVVSLALNAPDCGTKGVPTCIGLATPIAVGIPMVAWGLATHAAAVRAAGGKSPPATGAGVFVTPFVGTKTGEPSGAAVVGVF